MTTRISLVKALPTLHWGELQFLKSEPVDWHLDLAFLLYLWEIGEETILETAFYEPFNKSVRAPHLPLFMRA
jgi:hypothetical protein